jgi:hypothetical protein
MHFRNGSEGALRVPRSSMVTYCLLTSARFATSACVSLRSSRSFRITALSLLGDNGNYPLPDSQ